VCHSRVESRDRSWALAARAARALVGGLFLVSAYGKIVAPQRFAEEIRAYELLPVIGTNLLAYTLPWVELLAGLLLVICVWRREARAIIAALLVVFTFAKAYTFARGLDIDCGCGGGVEVLRYIYDSPQGILTNLVLLALLGVDWRAGRGSRPAPRHR
jgi:uncharacterized membrane protein YphA (DoxX/SURF4 family)